jgi:membrane carboxypeptidase/penicillin-binding protein
MWNANNILWRGASLMHFTEQEIFGLWVECALSRCDGGLNFIARKYFGKELLELSQRELASLVAVVRSPTRYAPGTESGKKRTNEILEKAKTRTTNITAN